MKPLLAAARLGALSAYAYRTEAVAALMSAVVVATLSASIWGALMTEVSTLAGLGRTQVVTYAVVAWLVGSAVNTRLDRNLADRYRDGRMVSDLLRPLDLHQWTTALDAGRAAATLLLTSAPAFGVLALFFDVHLPVSPVRWGLFATALMAGVVIGAQLALLSASALMPLHNAEGAVTVRIVITALLSGAAIPYAAMPPAVAEVLTWMPTASLAHLPAMLLVSEAPVVTFVAPLLVQIGWCVLLVLLARAVWSRALSRMAVAGG